MSVIELKDIMKTYQMGDSVVHALYHVNLKIEPGEFTYYGLPAAVNLR